jgi:hypothetical protein
MTAERTSRSASECELCRERGCCVRATRKIRMETQDAPLCDEHARDIERLVGFVGSMGPSTRALDEEFHR